jgi:hypothetical protein
MIEIRQRLMELFLHGIICKEKFIMERVEKLDIGLIVSQSTTQA